VVHGSRDEQARVSRHRILLCADGTSRFYTALTSEQWCNGERGTHYGC
jgi:hypothetical protein